MNGSWLSFAKSRAKNADSPQTSELSPEDVELVHTLEDSDSEGSDRVWWAQQMFSLGHDVLSSYPWAGIPVRLLSACTGSFAEAAAFKELDIPFLSMGCSEPNKHFRDFVLANYSTLHFHATMEDQLAGAPCLLHGREEACAVDACDYLVLGTPCNPFSTQRLKRFCDGSIKGHALSQCTFASAISMLKRFEPPTATMEQTEGFMMRESSASHVTPLQRQPVQGFLAEVEKIHFPRGGYIVTVHKLKMETPAAQTCLAEVQLEQQVGQSMLSGWVRYAQRAAHRATGQQDQAAVEVCGVGDVDAPQPPCPKKAGRPRGTFGGSSDRAAMQAGLARLAAPKARQLIPLGRGIDDSRNSLTGTQHVFELVNIGTNLQKQVFLFAQDQARLVPLDDGNPATDHLCNGRKPVTSLAALAQQAEFSRWLVKKHQVRVASAALTSGGYLAGSLLAKLKHMITEDGYVPLVMGTSRKYDETPLKLRVQEATAGDSSWQKGVAAKVMQTRLHVFALLRHPETKESVQFVSEVPTALRVMDSATANNVMATQQQALDKVAGLGSFSKLFRLRVSLVCTDRAAQNIAAERLLAAELNRIYECSWAPLHTFCDIHRIAQVEKATSDLLKNVLSGMVSVGKATQTAGATRLLRTHLREILQERLEVRVGAAQYEPDRAPLYDFLLSDVATTFVPEQRKQSVCTLRKRQRIIFLHYLNGDLSSESIIHYTLEGKTRDQILGEMEQWLIPALCPGPCPFLNRGRFLGMEQTAQWVGILSVHHNILAALLQKLHGRPVSLPEDRTVAAGPASGTGGWAAFAAARAARARQRRAPEQASELESVMGAFSFRAMQEVEALPADMEEEAPGNTGDLDWGALNRASKKKAAMFGATRPGSLLALMLYSMQPVLQLLSSFIALSSAAFGTAQDTKALQGSGRAFRVTEVACGRQVDTFQASLSEKMQSACFLVPLQMCNVATRGLLFRLMSRQNCAVHQLLVRKHRNPPYSLFKALLGQSSQVENTDPCLLDGFTRTFLEVFPDLDSLDAQQSLAALAEQMSVDILEIEARHATPRRIVTVRGTQTWALSVLLLGAEWVLRQSVIMREPVVGTKKQERKRPRHVRTQKPKVTKAGGAWRAFVHLHGSGRRLDGAMFRSLSVRYRLLKAAQSEEYQVLKNLGLLATLSARAGGARFLKQSSGRVSTAVVSMSDGVEDKLKQLRLQRREQLRAADEAAALARRTTEEAAQVELLRLQEQTLPADTSSMDSMVTGSFRCCPGNETQPAVARFCPPVDRVAEA
ncbi:unnamed protein product [Symbiodinium sp. CCMP2592]|nr:unnamed protein product [Symbiodinium sp. CCMP2592]